MTRTNYTKVAEGPILDSPLNILDDKGRKIGMLIALEVRTYVPAADNATSWWTQEPGVWYAATLQASRDGKHYGASPGTVLFRTQQERRRYIEFRIDRYRERCAKKF